MEVKTLMLINILIVTDDVPGWSIKLSRELHDASICYYPELEERRTIETNLFRFSIVSNFVEGRHARYSLVILDKEMNRNLYTDVLRRCIYSEIKTDNFKLT